MKNEVSNIQNEFVPFECKNRPELEKAFSELVRTSSKIAQLEDELEANKRARTSARDAFYGNYLSGATIVVCAKLPE